VRRFHQRLSKQWKVSAEECTSTDRQGGRRRTESGAAAGLEEISERLMLVAEWRAGDVELCGERVAV